MLNVEINIGATKKQALFIDSPERVSAFIGGVGSGKTRASVLKALKQPPGSVGMLIAPTYTMLRDAMLRAFLEIANKAHILAAFNKSELNAQLINGTEILFRSADRPDRLRGPNLGWVGIDEAALVDREALDILLGRVRLQPERLWFTTTPKGKRHWLYGYIQSNTDVVTATSAENPFLSKGFLAGLKAGYSPEFYKQEVLGMFIDSGASVFKPALYYSELPKGSYRVLHGFDAAYSDGRGDYSVCITMRVYGEKIYITDILRERMEPNHFIPLMQARGIKNVSWRRSGTEKGYVLLLKNAGIAVREYKASKSKLDFAMPYAQAWNRGDVLLPADAEWLPALEAEHEAFTGDDDEHDDIIDAAAAAYASMINMSSVTRYI